MMGFSRGGGEIWDLQMAQQLREMGVDVTFVIGVPLRAEVPHPVEDFPTIQVPIPHLQERALELPRGVGGLLSDIDALLFARRAAKTLAPGTDFDLVHVNNRPEFARHVQNFVVPVTIKLNGPPHSFWYDTVHPRRSSYDLLEAFEGVVTTGMTTANVRAQVDLERVVQINPGVDTARFAPSDESETTPDTPELLYVGRFVPAKNLDRLLDLFAALREHRDVELTMVGDGPLRDELEEKASRLGVAESVSFEGYVENAALPAVYRRADVFVLTSRADNHPITILEAMSCGIPVVAPRVGWIPNLIAHEDDGLIYDRTAPSEPAESVERLLDSSELRARLGNRARQAAVRRFDWENRAAELRELFEAVRR
jgi:glycosyltransferase involved in cell wall biosynthesis